MYPVTALRRWKRAGLLSELRPTEASRLLAKREPSSGPPSPRLLHAYYAAQGDVVEAQWRRQTDHYLEVHTQQHPSDVARALELALPAVGPILVRMTPTALQVQVGADVVRVSRVVRHVRMRARQMRRPVDRPRDIVVAVNAVLAARDYPRRFVELRAAPDRHAFVAVEMDQAKTLLRWNGTEHADARALFTFTAWDRRPARAAS